MKLRIIMIVHNQSVINCRVISSWVYRCSVGGLVEVYLIIFDDRSISVPCSSVSKMLDVCKSKCRLFQGDVRTEKTGFLNIHCMFKSYKNLGIELLKFCLPENDLLVLRDPCSCNCKSTLALL